MDLPLVNADLIGAGRFGDPDFPVFDDQMVCAAGCTIEADTPADAVALVVTAFSSALE